jgi:hypothetical protein
VWAFSFLELIIMLNRSHTEEISYDANIGMGLMLEDLPSQRPDPFDALVEVEEHLMRDHGLTLLQAARRGFKCNCHD